jgi:hypothetical protein
MSNEESISISPENGYVGIGNSQPTAALHILQQNNAPAFRVDDVAGDTTPFIIAADGSVGIGTTQPSELLHIDGSVYTSGSVIIDWNGTTAPLRLPNSGTDNPSTLANGDIWHRTNTLFAQLNGTTRTLIHNGNPTTLANDISQGEAQTGTNTSRRWFSALRVRQAIAAYAPAHDGTDATGTWGISITGNAATVTNGVYTVGDQAIAGMKTFSGNVGVGTATALERLHVQGSTRITGNTVLTSNTASTSSATGALVVTGGVGIGGALNVSGNLTVAGDLTINGTTTSINTATVNVEDNIIRVNANQTGDPSALLLSGIEVERGSKTNYQFVFEEATDLFKVGITSELQAVATRPDAVTDRTVAIWDDASKQYTFQDNVVVTPDGNVGIGTANPTQRLHVNGTVLATSFSGNGANITNLNMANASSGTLAVARGGTGTTTSTGTGSVVLNNAPTFTGTVTAPTFSGALTGNATTATTLQTTRAINGTNFDGSAAITTANWGTSRTLTIGSTGKAVNGGSNVSWTLAEIGAAASSHTHSAADITSGTLAVARGGTGVTTSTGTGSVVLSNAPSFTGNVGIGTDDPSHTLDVVGDINFTGSLLSNGTSFTGSKWTSAGNNISYVSGNVGIGVTTPTSRLHVNSPTDVMYMLNNNLSNNAVTIFGAARANPTLSGTSDLHGTLFINSTDSYERNRGASIALGGRGGNFGGGNQHMTFARITGTQTNNDDLYRGDLVLETMRYGSLFERMRIKENGNVGIGTDDPSHTLDVVGDINFTGSLLSNGTSFTGSKWTSAGNNISYVSGNVGIGTASPLEMLHVENGHAIIRQSSGSTRLRLMAGSSDDFTRIQLGHGTTTNFTIRAGNSTSGQPNRLDLFIGDDEAGDKTVLSARENGLLLFKNVGISSSSFNPTTALHVKGGVRFEVMPGFRTEGTVVLGRADNTDRNHEIVVRNDGTGSGNWLRFDVHNGSSDGAKTEVMRLLGDGNVGIGVINPTERLHVNGSVLSTDMVRHFDIRQLKPSDIAGGRVRFGFGTWNNNNSTPYSDILHLNGWNDASGQNTNALMIRKDTFGIRQYQGTFNSSTNYSSFRDVVMNGANENVGIGTDNPTSRLHVNGDVNINGNVEHGQSKRYILGISNNNNHEISIPVIKASTFVQFIIDIHFQGVARNSSGEHFSSITGMLNVYDTNQDLREISSKINDVNRIYVSYEALTKTTGNIRVRVRPMLGFNDISISRVFICVRYNRSTTLGDATTTDLGSNAAVPVHSFFNNNSHLFGGNVGIGTANPQTNLHVNGRAFIHTGEVGAPANGVYGGNNGTRLILWPGSTSGTPYALGIDNSTLWYGVPTSAVHRWYTGTTERMILSSTGNVGIGLTNPEAKLHVNGNLRVNGAFTVRGTDFFGQGSFGNTSALIGGNGFGNSVSRAGGIVFGDGTGWQYQFITRSGINNSIVAHIRDNAANRALNFTGQHRCFVADTSVSMIETLSGLIVSTNRNDYISMSFRGKYESNPVRGVNGIDVNESLPIVSLTRKYKDKSVFGVISSGEDPNNREDSLGNITSVFPKLKGDTRAYINSVGEGAIWVINANGTLESGDYITSSHVPGYGTKQESESLANYTVAKITMDCDFTQPQRPKLRIARTEKDEPIIDSLGNITWVEETDQQGNVVREPYYNIRYVDEQGTIISREQYNELQTNGRNVYIAAFVGCTYHCG